MAQSNTSAAELYACPPSLAHPGFITDSLNLCQIPHISVTIQQPQLKPKGTILAHGGLQRHIGIRLPALAISWCDGEVSHSDAVQLAVCETGLVNGVASALQDSDVMCVQRQE